MFRYVLSCCEMRQIIILFKMSRQVAVLYYTGHIVYAIAVHTKSACAPNFSNFPWGVQVKLDWFHFSMNCIS